MFRLLDFWAEHGPIANGSGAFHVILNASGASPSSPRPPLQSARATADALGAMVAAAELLSRRAASSSSLGTAPLPSSSSAAAPTPARAAQRAAAAATTAQSLADGLLSYLLGGTFDGGTNGSLVEAPGRLSASQPTTTHVGVAAALASYAAGGKWRRSVDNKGIDGSSSGSEEAAAAALRARALAAARRQVIAADACCLSPPPDMDGGSSSTGGMYLDVWEAAQGWYPPRVSATLDGATASISLAAALLNASVSLVSLAGAENVLDWTQQRGTDAARLVAALRAGAALFPAPLPLLGKNATKERPFGFAASMFDSNWSAVDAGAAPPRRRVAFVPNMQLWSELEAHSSLCLTAADALPLSSPATVRIPPPPAALSAAVSAATLGYDPDFGGFYDDRTILGPDAAPGRAKIFYRQTGALTPLLRLWRATGDAAFLCRCGATLDWVSGPQSTQFGELVWAAEPVAADGGSGGGGGGDGAAVTGQAVGPRRDDAAALWKGPGASLGAIAGFLEVLDEVTAQEVARLCGNAPTDVAAAPLVLPADAPVDGERTSVCGSPQALAWPQPRAGTSARRGKHAGRKHKKGGGAKEDLSVAGAAAAAPSMSFSPPPFVNASAAASALPPGAIGAATAASFATCCDACGATRGCAFAALRLDNRTDVGGGGGGNGVCALLPAWPPRPPRHGSPAPPTHGGGGGGGGGGVWVAAPLLSLPPLSAAVGEPLKNNGTTAEQQRTPCWSDELPAVAMDARVTSLAGQPAGASAAAADNGGGESGGRVTLVRLAVAPSPPTCAPPPSPPPASALLHVSAEARLRGESSRCVLLRHARA